MGFGNTLSNLLKSKNMTVAELAKKTGISSSTLYAIIRRDSDNVNLSAIQKIAHELNVSVETLIPSKNPQHLFSQILDFSDDFLCPDHSHFFVFLLCHGSCIEILGGKYWGIQGR